MNWENSKRLGNVGEIMTIAEFVKLQIPVYIPFGDTEKADLIAEFNNKLNKIQVKTCDHVQPNGDKYIISLTSSTEHRKNGVKHKYNKNEIDYFALCCIERNKVLLIPVFSEPRSSITIRIIPPESKNQHKSFMEEDYILSKVIKEYM